MNTICPNCKESHPFEVENERIQNMPSRTVTVVRCCNCKTAIGCIGTVAIEEDLSEMKSKIDDIHKSSAEPLIK